MVARPRSSGPSTCSSSPPRRTCASVCSTTRRTSSTGWSLNLRASFDLVRAFGPGMAERGRGSIIGFSSIRAVTVEPGQGVYAATKAGLVQLLRTAAAELGPGRAGQRRRAGRRGHTADRADPGRRSGRRPTRTRAPWGAGRGRASSPAPWSTWRRTRRRSSRGASSSSTGGGRRSTGATRRRGEPPSRSWGGRGCGEPQQRRGAGGHARGMSFEDLPRDWAQRPLTDPDIFEDVVDLVTREKSRAAGAIMLLLCHPDGRMPSSRSPSRTTRDR